MEPTITVDVSDLNRKLRNFAPEVGRDLPDVIRQAGRVHAKACADFAQPYGPFNQARRKVQATISSDIGRVYMLPSEMYELMKEVRMKKGSRQKPGQVAKAFYGALINNNVERARRIMQSSGVDGRSGLTGIKIGKFDKGAEHRSRRNRANGRVTGKASMVLTDPKGVPAYIRKAQKNAGTAKGSFAEIMRLLGSTSGVPGWLVKAGEGHGRLQSHLGENDPYVILGAELDYLTRVISSSSLAAAERSAAARMEKFIRIVLKKRAEAASR